MPLHFIVNFDVNFYKAGNEFFLPFHAGKFCGNKTPKRPLRPSGHKVFIRFKSDDSTGGRGFQLEWNAEKLEVKKKGRIQ